MAGYNDPRFAKGPVKGPDSRWRGHQVPPDPAPQDGAIRVFARGRWMTWETWRSSIKVTQDGSAVAPTNEGTTGANQYPSALVPEQFPLF
jgi:hypothetical protein